MAGIGINLHTQESKFETLEEAKSNNSVPETNVTDQGDRFEVNPESWTQLKGSNETNF